jgi:GTP-binding protein
MSRIVAIIGRPNVGKSTLFNRLTGSRKAIVDDVSGVTRDRHYGVTDWNGEEFILIDTGGYVAFSEDVFETEIRKQVALAIQEAGLLLFMVDLQTGITHEDQMFAEVVRKANKPTIVVVNKTDTFDKMSYIAEFYALGFEEVLPLSSMSGTGTGEILDKVIEWLPKEESKLQTDLPKIAIVGRPNVGKSTLINQLLDEDRNIVSNIPGTTRDSIHSEFNKYGHHFILIDTAGLRKKGKTMDNIEFYSVMRTISAIEESDVCILMIDAKEGMQTQDVNIFRLAVDRGKGIVIAVNKWDTVEKETNTAKEYTETINNKTAPFTDVPIHFISAIEKQRLLKIVESSIEVYYNLQRKVSTSKLNELLLPIIENFPPPATKGKYIKIKYITQLPTKLPSFAFFCNLPQYIREPYKRFLENKLRENFNFNGVPIRIFFRKK